MLECSGKEIYLACGSTDMRNGLDGQAAVANLRFACDYFESAIHCCHGSKKLPETCRLKKNTDGS